MSNYTREARRFLQQCYGGYCNMCRDKNIKPVPYHVFADNFIHSTKTTYKKLHEGRY